jgi:hypothetical protein
LKTVFEIVGFVVAGAADATPFQYRYGGSSTHHGANIPNVYRQAGVYAGQILKGAKREIPETA